MSDIYNLCLVGLGPAGVGFLSAIDKSVLSKSICFEQGAYDSQCHCHMHNKSQCFNCDQCSIISGIGGASRFSCGKISNYPAGSGLEPFFASRYEMINFMNSEIEQLTSSIGLKKFIVSEEQKKHAEMHFKKDDITFKYYDVYEFEKESYIKYFMKTISCAENNGLNVYYNAKVINIEKSIYNEQLVYIITVRKNNGIQKYKARKVVFATGNINHDTIINTVINPLGYTYELGIRITVPTKSVSDYLRCHGDLKLKHKNGKTYCVSKNGFVIAYSVDNMRLLEGYIDSNCCTDTTNLAIIFKCENKMEIDIFKDNYKSHFNGMPIKQMYIDFLNNANSKINLNEKYISLQAGNIRHLFNDDINLAIIDFIDTVLIKSLQVDPKEITLYAPELKTAVDYLLTDDFQGAKDFYIIGAATGKFRGILQSFCSGVRCANEIRR